VSDTVRNYSRVTHTRRATSGRVLAQLCLALIQQPQLVDRDGLDVVQRARRNAIQRELAEPNVPDWAGVYEGCMLAPRSGFLVTSPTCMGPRVTDGRVRAEGHRLELRSNDDPERVRVWWSVPWGARMYLVPERSMRDFCVQVNDGREPRTFGNFGPMMRLLDMDRTACGRPELSEPWSSLILDAPLTTRILRIERRALIAGSTKERETETRVTLHLGRSDGVRADQGFHLGKPWQVMGFVERVDATACIVLVDANDEKNAFALRVGDVASTRMTR
jgi:hypothetical protein